MNKQKIVNISILIIVIITLILSFYFFNKLKTLKTDPETTNKKEVINLVSKVADLYLLPVGEDPTIATVSQPEILKEQSFFTQAEKGDKVLIYAKSGKAILYRPSIDKIIEITATTNKNP